MEASPKQPPNAPLPMFVTLAGMAAVVSRLQFENASLPMVVTPDGMVTAVSEVEDAKAPCSMVETPGGITNSPDLASGWRMSVVLLLSNRTPSILL